MFLSGKKAFEKAPVNFLSIISAAPSHDFCKKNVYIPWKSSRPSNSWLVLEGWFIFKDSLLMVPSRLVDLDFVGYKQKNIVPAMRVAISPRSPAIALGNLGGLQPFSRFVRGPAYFFGRKGWWVCESKWPQGNFHEQWKKGPRFVV